MSLIRKLASAMVVPATTALVATGAGSAHAAVDLHGAIAVSITRVGEAVDYPIQHQADQAALDACGESVCRIVARIHNECGSVVEYDVRPVFGPTTPIYHAGTGATAAEAEKNAMPFVTPSNTLFTEIVRPPFVLDTICTSNAG